MLRRVGVLLVMMSMSILAACSDEPTPIPGGSVTIPESSTAPGSSTTPGASDRPAPPRSGPATIAPNPPSEADSPAADDLPARPGTDACVTIPEANDGRYRVYEAGTVVVLHSGDRLELSRVRAASGWKTEVDAQDDDEVKVEFRKGRQQLDLEIEIDDGEFTATICNEDDD